MTTEHGYAVNNLRALSAEVGRSVIVPRVSRNVMVAVIGANLESNGILLEGRPAGGKTKTANAIANAIGGDFKRIQGTTDLLPFDIVGSEILNRQSGELDFHPGPLFANIVLFDEINRAAPKAQAALLEGMQEGQVTVGNNTHWLPKPHRVLATRNPEEIAQGTYPLPLAGLDRFAASIDMPDLTAQQRKNVLNYRHGANQVMTPGDLAWTADTMWNEVFMDDKQLDHVNRVIDILHTFDMVDLESSVLGSGRILPNTVGIAKSLTAFDGEAGSPEVGFDHTNLALMHVLAHRTAVEDSHFDLYGATPQMAIASAIQLAA